MSIKLSLARSRPVRLEYRPNHHCCWWPDLHRACDHSSVKYVRAVFRHYSRGESFIKCVNGNCIAMSSVIVALGRLTGSISAIDIVRENCFLKVATVNKVDIDSVEKVPSETAGSHLRTTHKNEIYARAVFSCKHYPWKFGTSSEFEVLLFMRKCEFTSLTRCHS